MQMYYLIDILHRVKGKTTFPSVVEQWKKRVKDTDNQDNLIFIPIRVDRLFAIGEVIPPEVLIKREVLVYCTKHWPA